MSLPAASRLLRSAVRTQLLQAANVTSKPAKHHISAGDQAIALTVIFITIMGPSSWVLCHLEDYRNKS